MPFHNQTVVENSWFVFSCTCVPTKNAKLLALLEGGGWVKTAKERDGIITLYINYELVCLFFHWFMQRCWMMEEKVEFSKTHFLHLDLTK